MITISTSPDTINAAQNPIIYIANESDPSVRKMEILFTGINFGYPQTWYESANLGTTGAFEFDVSNVFEDTISYDLQDINGAGAFVASNSFDIAFITLNSYNLNANGQLQFLNTLVDVSNTFIHLNAAYQYEETQNILDYYMPLNALFADRKFLTKAPDSKQVTLTDSEFISACTANNISIGGALRLRIIKTDSGGDTTFDYTVPTAVWQTQRFDIGIAPANINGLSAGFIDSSTISYTVQFVDYLNGLISEKRTYILNSDCPISPTRVHFLNSLGGFDSFTFEGKQREGLSVKSVNYRKFLQKDYNIKDRGVNTLKTDAFPSLKARSIPLKKETRDWLQELAISPQIFIQDGSNYIPVVKNNFNWIIDDQVKDLQSLEIDFIKPKKISGRN